jgi:hypothetical protein
MLTHIAVLAAAVVSAQGAVTGAAVYRPRIEVWSNHGDGLYTRGQGVRVYFRTDQDAYVTVFRVDTDGRVRVLFPRDPWEDNFVRGERDFEVQGSSSRNAFYVDDYPGVGYVFGVAAADPFEYAAIESGNHWDYRAIADGRVRGDPYVALTELAERIVPEGYAEWDYDLVPYHVEQHYDYPRFLCYDCHSYVSYPYWNPYWRSCVRFRIVVYDDPYYYPYRYYGGTRVVFVRPFRPQPRFVFKDRDGSGRDNFVTRERQRPVNDDTRRTVTRRVTNGGAGLIPAPREATPRQRPAADERQRPAAGDRERPRNEAERARPRTGGGDDARGSGRGGAVGTDERPGTVAPGRAPARERPKGVDAERTAPTRTPVWTPRPESRSREQPRATPSAPRAPSRAEPRAEPRAAPRRDGGNSGSARAAPQPTRARPEARPAPAARGDSKGKSQPELRRRKP